MLNVFLPSSNLHELRDTLEYALHSRQGKVRPHATNYQLSVINDSMLNVPLSSSKACMNSYE
eukprot:4592298-Pyramimonas_sp.AAC.1